MSPSYILLKQPVLSFSVPVQPVEETLIPFEVVDRIVLVVVEIFSPQRRQPQGVDL